MIVSNTLRESLDKYDALQGSFIIAVSGGKDSMALLHACSELKLNMIVAHCNFSLRGEDSIEDERFVREYCINHRIPFEVIRFDTKAESLKRKLSIQETARVLRYTWFEELRNTHGANYILTAHHANDLAETFFLNLLRGSGLKGLRSIPPLNGSVLRPFLYLPLSDIEEYIAQNKLLYREDRSNESDAYARNYIRHHVIPKLEHLNVRAIEHIIQATDFLSEAVDLLADQTGDAAYATQYQNTLIIDFDKVLNLKYRHLLLFEWLSPFGFTSNTIREMGRSTALRSGSKWLSPTHVAFLDRGKLIVKEQTNEKPLPISFPENLPCVLNIGQYEYRIEETERIPELFKEGTLYLDKDLLALPARLRPWQTGDTFVPLGMKGEKKVSDFFIDAKISVPDKEQAVILQDQKGVAAVIPYRISDTKKIQANTKRVISICRIS